MFDSPASRSLGVIWSILPSSTITIDSLSSYPTNDNSMVKLALSDTHNEPLIMPVSGSYLVSITLTPESKSYSKPSIDNACKVFSSFLSESEATKHNNKLTNKIS
jgi:hypothetical protein